ncbi:MAG: YkgJ family cysteine cluster protein [Deltaproteobacteria bacterium]|nr:YkgJ family cysteine cluster protein [Deltaproteobacteria bacterium]
MNELAEPKEIFPGQAFCFSCGPGLSCFNACCRDLNQFLTPYDILRLKGNLALSSEEFLGQWADIHTGPQTGLPVVTLKPAGPEGECPFLSPQGCRVYPDRPSSCRAYPLVRLVGRNRATGQVSERWFLLREDHCRGFEESASITPEQWVESQELLPYNRMNDRFMTVLAAKNRLGPGPLPEGLERDFRLACYGLDSFGPLLEQGRIPGAEAASFPNQED